MHILSEPDVAQIFRRLTQEKCHEFIDVLSKALVAMSAESKPNVPDSEKLIHQPLRTVFATKADNSCIFMPVSDTVSTGVKVVTVASGGIQGVINVFSPDGRLQGLLAAAEVTAFRTALASMTLFVRCTSLRKENILVFGCGRQAEWHARLALILYPEQIRQVTFVNRGRQRLDELERDVLVDLRQRYPNITFATFSKEHTADYGARLEEELQACDVIFSCTPSIEPNFSYSALQSAPKQRFISLIGSYKPHMHEIDSETLLSGGGRIYVDSKSACMEESGELNTAKVTEDQLTEMGDLLGELSPEQALDIPDGCNVIYKCVGMGLMDLIVGKKVLDVGKEQGLGTHVDGF
jgi:ornithine cyclodeaminase/alanine dehydrogenase-like protein (mu-crystallin family)